MQPCAHLCASSAEILLDLERRLLSNSGDIRIQREPSLGRSCPGVDALSLAEEEVWAVSGPKLDN